MYYQNRDQCKPGKKLSWPKTRYFLKTNKSYIHYRALTNIGLLANIDGPMRFSFMGFYWYVNPGESLTNWIKHKALRTFTLTMSIVTLTVTVLGTGFTWNIKPTCLQKIKVKNVKVSSAAILLGALRVNKCNTIFMQLYFATVFCHC